MSVKWTLKYVSFGLKFRKSIIKADEQMLKIMKDEIKREEQRRNKNR